MVKIKFYLLKDDPKSSQLLGKRLRQKREMRVLRHKTLNKG